MSNVFSLPPIWHHMWSIERPLSTEPVSLEYQKCDIPCSPEKKSKEAKLKNQFPSLEWKGLAGFGHHLGQYICSVHEFNSHPLECIIFFQVGSLLLLNIRFTSKAKDELSQFSFLTSWRKLTDPAFCLLLPSNLRAFGLSLSFSETIYLNTSTLRGMSWIPH